MEMIEIRDMIPVLNASVAVQIADFEKQMKVLKEKEDALKQQILKEMEQKNILRMENDALSITYVAPTTRETFDAKSLREELPDIYDAYAKIANVKASVRIKVK